MDFSYFTAIEIERSISKSSKTRSANIKAKKIKGNSVKRVTSKSVNRFVMHKYEVHVEIEGVILPILNITPIENDCLVYPTPLNYMQDKPKQFNIVADKFKDRVELIKTFWSRYDFKKEPAIKEVTSDGVILEE